jgi:histidine triad (HIT) family protein
VTDCIFCRIASGEIPARLAGRSDHAVAFHDLNPQAPVHVLVVPAHHLGGANDTAATDGAIWSELMALAVRVAGELGLADGGYRLVVNQGRDGGQSVGHLHVHLLGGRRLGWPPG